MPDFSDAYSGTTGLKEEFTGTLKNAVFTYDSDYNNGNTLIARLEFEDEGDGEEVVLKLSTGSGWEDDEKGRVAKREDGSDPKGFNKSCVYQRWVEALLGTDYRSHMIAAGPPWDMSIFDGEPRFEMVSLSYKGMNNADKSLSVPGTFLGFAGKKSSGKGGKSSAKAAATEEAAPAAPTAAEKAAAAKARAAAKAAEASGGDEDEGMAKLKAIASETDSHDEFMERAYVEVDNADAYEETIVDEAWYEANHG